MVQQKPGWFPSPFCLNGLFVRDRRPCVAFVLLPNQPRSDDTNQFIVFDRRLHRTAFGDLLTTIVFPRLWRRAWIGGLSGGVRFEKS